MSSKGVFIVDANVLIDYVEVDASVLGLISDHLGPIHVPRRILGEVKRLKYTDCEALGLTVVTEDYPELIAAAAMATTGPLSFQDYLVLIMAKGRTWTPITNDGGLRKVLEREKVPKRWGLEMMLELVEVGCLSRDKAVVIAEQIVKINSRYAVSVLEGFKKKIAIKSSVK